MESIVQEINIKDIDHDNDFWSHRDTDMKNELLNNKNIEIKKKTKKRILKKIEKEYKI